MVRRRRRRRRRWRRRRKRSKQPTDIFSSPHAVEDGTVWPNSNDFVFVCDMVLESVFDPGEMCIWHPYELEHLWVEGQSFGVTCVIVHQPWIFPVLTKVHDRCELLKKERV